MHPYVYKKHHKTYQLLAVVTLYYLMILPQPTTSSSCFNFPIKKIGIYSDFSKGYVRIEGDKVVANQSSIPQDNNNYLYKVTIDKHYMLLYHIESRKFICWNKTFRKLIPKRNPQNLAYCKFEDKLSKIKAFQGSRIRYISKGKGREVEMRFNKSGAFAKPKLIEKCVKKFKLHHKLKSKIDFLKLDTTTIEDGSEEMKAYTLLMKKCANPDFLQIDKCVSGSYEFCQRMKELTTLGRMVSREIKELCKNEWSKSN